MNGMVAFFSAVIGFATVMAAISLAVSALVRLLHYLLNSRGKTLVELLATLNQRYREQHGEPSAMGDAQQMAFAIDVLTHPVLHPQASSDDVARAKRPRRGRSSRAERIQYIQPATLLQIIKDLCIGPGNQKRLRPTWHVALADESFDAFASFTETWFSTLESVSTDEFRKRSRRMVAVVSAVVVVLFDIDGLGLLGDLRRDTYLRDYLISRAPTVSESANKEQAESEASDSADPVEPKLLPVLLQVNGILNEPSLNFGWQRNWFSKRWCAYHGCLDEEAKRTVEKPTGFELCLDAGVWLAGLFFSCCMLALGAPFWADFLATALKSRTALGPLEGYRKQPK